MQKNLHGHPWDTSISVQGCAGFCVSGRGRRARLEAAMSSSENPWPALAMPLMNITPSFFIHRHFWTWETWDEVTCSADPEKEVTETDMYHGPGWVQGSPLQIWEPLLSPANPLQQVGHIAAAPCLSTEVKNAFSRLLTQVEETLLRLGLGQGNRSLLSS